MSRYQPLTHNIWQPSNKVKIIDWAKKHKKPFIRTELPQFCHVRNMMQNLTDLYVQGELYRIGNGTRMDPYVYSLHR